MDCHRARKLITPYLEGHLSGNELLDFLDHIRECENCHSELETWFMIDRTVKSFQNHTEVVYDMRGMLDRHLEEEQIKMSRIALYRKLFLLFVILVGIGIAAGFAVYFMNMNPDLLKGLL